MKQSIEVTDRREGESIRAGLEDPTIRAFVMILGELKSLPNKRARQEVLQWVQARLQAEETTGPVMGQDGPIGRAGDGGGPAWAVSGQTSPGAAGPPGNSGVS